MKTRNLCERPFVVPCPMPCSVSFAILGLLTSTVVRTWMHIMASGVAVPRSATSALNVDGGRMRSTNGHNGMESSACTEPACRHVFFSPCTDLYSVQMRQANLKVPGSLKYVLNMKCHSAWTTLGNVWKQPLIVLMRFVRDGGPLLASCLWWHISMLNAVWHGAAKPTHSLVNSAIMYNHLDWKGHRPASRKRSGMLGRHGILFSNYL